MTRRPLVVFGCLLYNNARHLPQAIESLLSQTYPDFKLILLDDCSSDGTPAVAERYTWLDPRVVYVRNRARLGYIGNARKAFDLAREWFPGLEYFAWSSDHDVWHPEWLRLLLRELEQDHGLALAYPMTVRISDTGEFRWEPRKFETAAITDIRGRLGAAVSRMAAGDMIYGLFRRSALEGVAGFLPVLLPDRLLLSEAALYGRFKQVPDVLWYRRYWGLASYARQRAAFFPSGRYPAYTYLPWWLVHGVILFRRLAVQGTGRPEITRRAGAKLSALYVLLAFWIQVRRVFRIVRRGLKRTRKHIWQKRIIRFAGRARKRVRRAVAENAAVRRRRAAGKVSPRPLNAPSAAQKSDLT